jgi:acetyltransferase-like isoleucine patch superfamily enzyme
MNWFESTIKIAWWVGRNGFSGARFLLYKSLSGTFFKKIGWGTKFYGSVRFGTVEGNIILGKKCLIGHDVFFSAGKNCSIVIGDNCSLNTGCHIVAVYGIQIGSHTRIGEYCSIRDQNHCFEDPAQLIFQQGFQGAPILIGQDVWIGRGVLIAPGVEIGDGCIIGANSVVTHSLEPYSIVGGVPARFIRKRGNRLPN